MIMAILAALLAVPAFAFYYRCRGGFIGTGSTTLARCVFWAVPVGMFMHNPLCGVLAFLGLLIPHAWAQADAKPIHVAGMAAIGMARMILILMPIIYISPVAILATLTGLGSGLGYALGYGPLSGKSIGIELNGDNLVSTPSSWGELITGAFMGLGMALAQVLA